MENLCDIKIKYDGLKLGTHQMPLADLGKSLTGIAGVLGMTSTYVMSGSIENNPNKWPVQITSDARIQSGSIEIVASILTSIPFTELSISTGNLIEAIKNLCAYLFGNRESDDMEKIQELLNNVVDAIVKIEQTHKEELDRIVSSFDKQEQQSKEIIERLTQSLDNQSADKIKLAQIEKEKLIALLQFVKDGHRYQSTADIERFCEVVSPNLKNTMQPVGSSCKTVSLYDSNEPDKPLVVADEEIKKKLISQKAVTQLFDEELDVIFVAMDRTKGTCRFVMASDADMLNDENTDAEPTYYKGKIRDPEFDSGSNAYSRSFDTEEPLHIVARVKRTANSNSAVYFIMSHK